MLVSVLVGMGVFVVVGAGVLVAVAVGSGVLVEVAVGSGVLVGSAVAVDVAVGSGVSVTIGTGVGFTHVMGNDVTPSMTLTPLMRAVRMRKTPCCSIDLAMPTVTLALVTVTSPVLISCQADPSSSNG